MLGVDYAKIGFYGEMGRSYHAMSKHSHLCHSDK